MVTEITINKFKGLRASVQLQALSNVNYLVGKNNSGKSSILQAILISSQGFGNEESSTTAINEVFAKKAEYFTDENISLPIEVLYRTTSGDILVEIKEHGSKSLQKYKRHKGTIPKSLYIPCSSQMHMVDSGASYTDIEHALRNTGILPSQSFASWIWWNETLENQDTNKFNTTTDSFRLFKEFIGKNFSVEITRPIITKDGRHVLKYFENGSEKNLHLLGSGTQTAIYLIGALMYLRDYKLILIDEPEIHLHPSLQKILPETFNQLAKELNCQLIVATQSPFIVSQSRKDDSIYKLYRDTDNTVKSEFVQESISYAISMEIGGSPDDVGAPENFVLLEEYSCEVLLREVNKRFYQRNIQFISCSSVTKVSNRNNAMENIISHDVILKCTPIYHNRYYIVIDQINQEIRKDRNLSRVKGKLGDRFIELQLAKIEDYYPDEIVEKFMLGNPDEFASTERSHTQSKITSWLTSKDYETVGRRKAKLAKYVGQSISQEKFEELFSDLNRIFI